MIKPVKKVVFPVNGLGTRFLPATKAMPKEMIPVVDKPLIQYAVEEAVAAGMTDLIFVTGRNKRSIEDHFDRSVELERDLQAKGKHELLEILRSIVPAGINCIYLRQPQPLGLGHAVLCAQPVVGNEPFAVMLADDLVQAQKSCIGQLLDVRAAKGGGSVVAVQNVSRETVSGYGVVSVTDPTSMMSRMHGIVEKPAPEAAPSTLAVIGRYVFEPSIFDKLKDVQPGVGGEIQLTDAIAEDLKTNPTYAYRFEGTRYDCGSKQGFIDATVALARARGFVIR